MLTSARIVAVARGRCPAALAAVAEASRPHVHAGLRPFSARRGIAQRGLPLKQLASSSDFPARSFATDDAAETGEADEAGAVGLVASADSNVPGLGGAIAARMRDFGRASIRSIGVNAAYRTTKALVNAGEYLQQDPGPRPPQEGSGSMAVRLSERAELQRPEDSGEEVRRTVMIFEASYLPSGLRGIDDPAPAGTGAEGPLIVGSATNTGKAAAAMAGRLRPQEAKVVPVRVMGAKAVYQALSAAALAQSYLDTDGKGVQFAVMPVFEKVAANSGDTPGNGRGTRQLVLKLVKVGG